MTTELYNKLLNVLTLGHMMYLHDLDRMDKQEQWVVFHQLVNMYKPEDMVEVIREFIRWYKDLEVEE